MGGKVPASLEQKCMCLGNLGLLAEQTTKPSTTTEPNSVPNNMQNKQAISKLQTHRVQPVMFLQAAQMWLHTPLRVCL